MVFFDEIKQTLITEGAPQPFFQVTLVGDSVVFLEGVKGIKEFSTEQITLFLNKGEITLFGEKMKIKKFCQGDLVVCGKINKIERL